MERDMLIVSASKLNMPGNISSTEYIEKSDTVLATINQRFRSRPELALLIGEGNLEMMENNHRNHLKFMISIIDRFDPTVFVETILWVYRAYRSHGVSLEYWPEQLKIWAEVLRSELSEKSFSEIVPFYEWMIANSAYFAELTD